MQLTQAQQDVISILKRSEHVLLLPSSPLDGDSLGSALSLFLALKKLGKKATVVAEETVPKSYGFLPEISSVSNKLDFVREFIVTVDCRDSEAGTVRHEIQGNKVNIFVTPKKGSISKDHVSFSQGAPSYDCVVSVDAGDPSQLGKLYDDFPELFQLVPFINIDHHASNPGFGKINLVDVMASSTTSLVLPLIEELGPGPDGKSLVDADISTLLLAGLITDTGSFQNPNTTPEAFAVAAKLISYGARQQEIIRNIYKTKKLSTLRLWGRTLTKIQYDEVHRMVWSVLTSQDFTELGGSVDETEGVIDELMTNAPNTDVIFLLKEKGPTEVSGSIRTLSATIDASKIAALFGGGGHVQAAGFKVIGKTIAQVEQEVVAGVRNFQKMRLGMGPVEITAAQPTLAVPAMPRPTPAPALPPASAVTVAPPAAQQPTIPMPQPQPMPMPVAQPSAAPTPPSAFTLPT